MDEVSLHTPADTPGTKRVKRSLHSKNHWLHVVNFLFFRFILILCNSSLSLSCVTSLLNILLFRFCFYIILHVLWLWSRCRFHIDHALTTVTPWTASWTQPSHSSMSPSISLSNQIWSPTFYCVAYTFDATVRVLMKSNSLTYSAATKNLFSIRFFLFMLLLDGRTIWTLNWLRWSTTVYFNLKITYISIHLGG